jgi:8-oxo-dGTP pyrophosphatase MutT (NUDIX family)
MRWDVAPVARLGKANGVPPEPDLSGFFRHINNCRNATLPGSRVPLWIGGTQVGWVGPTAAAVLRGCNAISPAPDGGLRLLEPRALEGIARALARRGLTRWRGEAFDVRAVPDGPVLAQVDRGALPALGIAATGVHVNGLVEREDGACLWVARRAADKALDAGKLDHIVAGGVPARLTPAETLVKEAAEEAAIPAELARQAVPSAKIAYTMERPEGLRRDHLHCYDLRLPADFRPSATDGEVESFELWPLTRAFATVRDTDDFKFNVNLVLIDLFLRRGLIAGPAGVTLRRALEGVQPSGGAAAIGMSRVAG